jgi:Arc/MetJ-type ribon-helix-helix transcriptional regulator
VTLKVTADIVERIDELVRSGEFEDADAVISMCIQLIPE